MSFADYKLRPADELGLVAGRLEELLLRARVGVEQGPLPSLQIALAREGKLALFTTLGEAVDSPRYNIFSCTKTIVASAIWLMMGRGELDTLGEAVDSPRYNIFSCTKTIVASAIWLMMGRGELDISAPVSSLIPEFSGSGKDAITIEQLLCHTAGIPHAPLGPPDWLTRAGRLEKMQSWRLNWEPGSRMEYHSSSAHWVLAELIERVSGMDFRDYIDQCIIRPLGLTGFQLGVPVDQQGDIQPLSSVGAPPTPEELKALFGVAMEWPDLPDDILLRFNEPETRALGVPGGGGISEPG
jgi:CubicO group peptidase (beta-lactamase class C family)